MVRYLNESSKVNVTNKQLEKQYKQVHFVLLIQRYLRIFVSRTRKTAVMQVHYPCVKEKPLGKVHVQRNPRKTFPTLTFGGFRHTKQMPGIRHMLILPFFLQRFQQMVLPKFVMVMARQSFCHSVCQVQRTFSTCITVFHLDFMAPILDVMLRTAYVLITTKSPFLLLFSFHFRK